MPDESDQGIIEELETRRAVREPTDVFKRLAEQAAFLANCIVVQSGAGLDKSEDEAFRRLRAELRVLLAREEIPGKETGAGIGSRRVEPKSAQRPGTRNTWTIALQIGLGEIANPS